MCFLFTCIYLTHVLITFSDGNINTITNKVGTIQCERTLTAALVSWTKPVTHCGNFGFNYMLKYTDSNKPGRQMAQIQNFTNNSNIQVPQWNSVVNLSVIAMCFGCQGVGPEQILTCPPSEFIH